jgi:hypothetical protein
MRSIWTAAALATCFAAVGCQSALITAKVSNHRATPVSLVEVDYPSASFGIQTLAPGQDYRYRFKVIGNGPASVLWDEGHNQKKSTGPILRDGDSGTLNVTFTDDTKPKWDVQLTNRTIR